MNTEVIHFTGGVDVSDQDQVCLFKGSHKILHQQFGSAVGVRLKEDHQAHFGETLSGSLEGGTDFSWMMAVVVDDRHASHLTLFFETPLSTPKLSQGRSG